MEWFITYLIAVVLFYFSTFFYKRNNLFKLLNIIMFFVPILNICYYFSYVLVNFIAGLGVEVIDVELNDRKDVRWLLNAFDDSYYHTK